MLGCCFKAWSMFMIELLLREFSFDIKLEAP